MRESRAPHVTWLEIQIQIERGDSSSHLMSLLWDVGVQSETGPC